MKHHSNELGCAAASSNCARPQFPDADHPCSICSQVYAATAAVAAVATIAAAADAVAIVVAVAAVVAVTLMTGALMSCQQGRRASM